jgi:phage terminase large subunit
VNTGHWDTIDILPNEASLIAYGLDFGYSNDPTTIIGVYKYNDNLIIDELVYETGLTNQNIANRLKSYDIKSEEIYADSAEPKSIKEIKNYGFRIMPTTKGKDSINYGIQLLQEKKIYITKKSKNVIEEFQRYMWKKDRAGETLNVPIDDFNHCIDAIRYVALSKFGKNDNRTPFFIG